MHSPRVFIFGDPVVRRESSSGGLAEEAIGSRIYRDKTVQRSRISIDSEAGTKRLSRPGGSHIPCDLIRQLTVVRALIVGSGSMEETTKNEGYMNIEMIQHTDKDIGPNVGSALQNENRER